MFEIKHLSTCHSDHSHGWRYIHAFVELGHETNRMFEKVWRFFEKGNPLNNRLSAWITMAVFDVVFICLYLLKAPLANYLCAALASLCLVIAAVMDSGDVISVNPCLPAEPFARESGESTAQSR
jgi:hypothetical protein